MEIYNYDRETKEFMSQILASINPLETNEFLIPACATTIETLITKDGFSQVFDLVNEKWDYVEDSRNVKVYNTTTKQEVTVDYIGALKDGFTKLIPNEFDVWNGTGWEIDLAAQSESQFMELKQAVQNLLDTTAQSLKYDNIQAIGKYVGYANIYRAESEALGVWTSTVWSTAEQIELDVLNGIRAMPTVGEVLLELPVY